MTEWESLTEVESEFLKEWKEKNGGKTILKEIKDKTFENWWNTNLRHRKHSQSRINEMATPGHTPL